MATTGQQGTGKHPHKSAAEPHPHTKDGKGDAKAAHGAPAKGEEPSFREDEAKRGKSSGAKAPASHGSPSKAADGGGRGADRADLKSREYRGEDGQIHHHTRTYAEDHKGAGDKR